MIARSRTPTSSPQSSAIASRNAATGTNTPRRFPILWLRLTEGEYGTHGSAPARVDLPVDRFRRVRLVDAEGSGADRPLHVAAEVLVVRRDPAERGPDVAGGVHPRALGGRRRSAVASPAARAPPPPRG